MITIIHIMITAGGTVEAIDSVRQISNTSTGRLGACIYEALTEHLVAGRDASGRSDKSAKGDSGFMVHYVVSETAVRPETNENLPIVFYPVSDVKSVESAVETLMINCKIDYVIHSMAVSDFTKGYLIEQEELVCELAETLGRALNESPTGLSGAKLKEYIGDVIKSPEHILDASTKVSSQAELMLFLKKTPKLIEKIKKLSPESFLVGFKLLKGVSEEELIRTAAELSEKNGCNLVLANDMNKIRNDRHEGLLLKGHQVVGRYHTKMEIARGIVQHMFGGGGNSAAVEAK
ncbi:MAG TPA: hypothetical protein DCY85_04025 [Firmicutes bacterium]|nr:hypothetical protein [Bacillota bacterium]